MAIGNGNYLLSAVVFAIVYATLELFNRLDDAVDRLHIEQTFKICCKANQAILSRMEQDLLSICPKMKRISLKKEGNVLVADYVIEGGKGKFEDWRNYLVSSPDIVGFEN